MFQLPFFKKEKKKTITYRSLVNGSITIAQSYGQTTVFSSDIPQSGGEYVFMWNKVLKKVKKHYPHISSCLILGVAGGTSVGILQNLFPGIKILGIELDSVMITVAKQYFSLKENKQIQILKKDAITFIHRYKKQQKFDCIIVDLYIKELNPAKARTKVFLKKIKQRTAANGVVIYNSHFQKQNPEEFDRFYERCSAVFSHVEIIFSYQRNHILLLQP